MKFWNKKKNCRANWTKISGPAYFLETPAKRWCQQNPSRGKFYFGYPTWTTRDDDKPPKLIWDWYFEEGQDAIAFVMKWKTR